MEELNAKVVFTIPVFGGIPVYESVVATWFIMAVLVLLSIIFVRNLKVEKPGKLQLFLETSIGFLRISSWIWSGKKERLHSVSDFDGALYRRCQSDWHSGYHTAHEGFECDGRAGSDQHCGN